MLRRVVQGVLAWALAASLMRLFHTFETTPVYFGRYEVQFTCNKGRSSYQSQAVKEL